MPPNARSADSIKSKVRQLEYEQQTTTYKNNAEERKVIKEIDTLKSLTKQAARLDEIQPKFKELISLKNDAFHQWRESKKVVMAKDVEIESLRKEMELIKEGQNDITSQIDSIKEQLDSLSKQIDEHYAKKDSIREAYYEKMWHYEVQRERINYLRDLHAQKQRLVEM